MRFDPNYFIALCQRHGLTLTRKGCYLECEWREDFAELNGFEDVIKRHKFDLLPLLFDTQPVKQMDVFIDLG